MHAQPTRQPAVNPSSSLHAALALGLSLCITAPGFCGEPSPGKLYYIHEANHTIYRMDLVDGDPQPVEFVPGSDLWKLAVHECKLYRCDDDLEKIERSNMDGSGLETIVENLGTPLGISIDPVADKMYFTTAFNAENAIIRKANLDGSNPEVVLPLSVQFASISLDVGAGKMYLLQRLNSGIYGIWRANLDGSNMQPVIAASPSVGEFALDLIAGHVYWREYFAGFSTDLIRRANLDGSNPQNVITGIEGGPIAVDPVVGKVYWGDYYRGMIWRANLDGSQVEPLTPYETGSFAGFFVAHGDIDAACGPHDPCPPKVDCEAIESIYWVDQGGDPPSNGRIWRSNADGTGVQMLHDVTAPYYNLNTIAIDKAGGKVYCTISPTCAFNGCPAVHVVRANLDGTGGIEDLVTLPHLAGARVNGVALNVGAGKMYFKRQDYPSTGGSTIYRANLDGTQIEEIYIGPNMGKLYLDVDAGVVYFNQTNRIKRASLNTVPLVPQDVVVEATRTNPVGFDFEARKVYYLVLTDPNYPNCAFPGIPPLAKRADLDSGQIEVLGNHENFNWCRTSYETLDIASQRLYRVPGGDPGGGNCGILRSNFADGSERFCTMFTIGGGGTTGDFELVMRDVIPGDITGDGVVNVNDLLAVVGTWGPCPAPPAPCPADIAPAPNGDGVVNVNDLLMVIGSWS